MGLFFSDVDEIKSAAETTSRITHSNSDGINGAILQALSTFCALNDMNSRDHIKFIQDVALEFQPGDKGRYSIYFSVLKEKKDHFSWKPSFKS